jgi:hypothetical protein
MEKKFVEGQKGDDITPFDGNAQIDTVHKMPNNIEK